MQGRLSQQINNQIQAFPKDSWTNEFQLAKKIGFDTIEWIYDLVPNNPILSENFMLINQLENKFDVSINSVCADYFMKNLLFNRPENEIEQNLDSLSALIKNCYKLSIPIIEIPLVDSSSLKNTCHKEELITNLSKVLPLAKEHGITLALETDLNPYDFNELLESFEHSIMANYDIGNSTANGFSTELELKILKKWVINVHVKDRILFGTTVPLGTGDVNFNSFFSNLQKINYSGDLII